MYVCMYVCMYTYVSVCCRTFKEDKLAVVSLVGSVDVSRQTPPEVTNGHGVIIQNPVPTDPPEPTTLRGHDQEVLFLRAHNFLSAIISFFLSLSVSSLSG